MDSHVSFATPDNLGRIVALASVLSGCLALYRAKDCLVNGKSCDRMKEDCSDLPALSCGARLAKARDELVAGLPLITAVAFSSHMAGRTRQMEDVVTVLTVAQALRAGAHLVSCDAAAPWMVMLRKALRCVQYGSLGYFALRYFDKI